MLTGATIIVLALGLPPVRENAELNAYGIASERLANSYSRIGHPDKIIPVAYLASRRDVSLVDGWEIGVARRDCGLVASTETLGDSNLSWIPGGDGGWIAPWSPEARAQSDLRLGWKAQ